MSACSSDCSSPDSAQFDSTVGAGSADFIVDCCSADSWIVQLLQIGAQPEVDNSSSTPKLAPILWDSTSCNSAGVCECFPFIWPYNGHPAILPKACLDRLGTRNRSRLLAHVDSFRIVDNSEVILQRDEPQITCREIAISHVIPG